MIPKTDVADAIKYLKDPFTCENILNVMGLRTTTKNMKAVKRVLNYFENRGWITMHSDNIYLRTFKGFSF